MLTFKRHDVNGMPGWRLMAGAAVLGTFFDAGLAEYPDERGMRWQGVAPDGTRFGATSRPKLAQKLQIHAAAARKTPAPAIAS